MYNFNEDDLKMISRKLNAGKQKIQFSDRIPNHLEPIYSMAEMRQHPRRDSTSVLLQSPEYTARASASRFQNSGIKTRNSALNRGDIEFTGVYDYQRGGYQTTKDLEYYSDRHFLPSGGNTSANRSTQRSSRMLEIQPQPYTFQAERGARIASS